MPHAVSGEWSAASEAHAQAIAQFAAGARTIPTYRWQEPLAKGKWSPAEVTTHLIEAYGVLRRELAGGKGMRPIGSPPRRWLLRQLVLPRLLRGMAFPPGVPAPIETRPTLVLPDSATAIGQLERVAAQFVAELEERQAAGSVWLTHAYFGRLSALHAVQLAAMHTRHHARQIARAAA